MKNIILGIDGLEFSVISHFLDKLPGFKKLIEANSLNEIESVFPADSVPAWNTIFTGLDPSEHGIVRGKDYVESIEEFETGSRFELKGVTFWDEVSASGKKVLVLNPFLAYPPWNVNGVFISGPAFISGKTMIYPEHNIIENKEVFGGYNPSKSGDLQKDISIAMTDTIKLKDLLLKMYSSDNYDLCFVTFTTLDRVQHYTWRYFDAGDPLHEQHPILSNSILDMLKIFDDLIVHLINNVLGENDNLIIISDHGFSRRPYNLINFNEIFRREKLLILNKRGNSLKSKLLQIVKNKTVKLLSLLKLLDIVAGKVRNVSGIKELKKSDHFIDKEKAAIYSDEKFCGKNPYCGFNFGKHLSNLSYEKKQEFIEIIRSLFEKYNLPKPLWIKLREDMFQGKYLDRYPDICMELESNIGVEFDLFGKIQTTSSTHYKISGGHLKDGVFAFYNKSGKTMKIKKLSDFKQMVIDTYNY